MWEVNSDDQDKLPAPVNTFRFLVKNEYHNSATSFVFGQQQWPLCRSIPKPVHCGGLKPLAV